MNSKSGFCLQHRQLKVQHREDMDGVHDTLSKIKSLSTQKDGHNKQLSSENDQLRSMVQSLTAERDAFEADNQAVVELLMQRGAHRLVGSRNEGGTLKLSVERLVSEKERQEAVIRRLEREKEKLSSAGDKLEGQVLDMRRDIEVSKAKSLDRESEAQEKVKLSVKSYDVTLFSLILGAVSTETA